MSAEKTLEIIDLFNFQRRELAVQEISILLNQPQSSVYRHLRVLKEKGYIVETTNGNYKLGYKFLSLAKVVKEDTSLSTIAFPIMRNLCTDLGETVILTIVSGLNAICLEVVTPDKAIKVSSEQGKILPLHAGASSRTLLAYMDDNTVDELYKKNMLDEFTEHTIVNVDELRKQNEVIRKKGYSISDSEVDEGVLGFGVAIMDMDNKLVAALSIAGPRERMMNQSHDDILEHLYKARNSIQEYL